MFAIIDIETTGGSANGDRITEVAVIVHDGERELRRWSSLVNPERRIPYRITTLTGITDALVEDAPKFYEVARQVVELTEGCTLVAHNAKFDYGFLKQAFRELAFEYKRPVYCTVEQSRLRLPGQRSYQLGALCKLLGIPHGMAHRAMADAEATLALFLHLQRMGRQAGAPEAPQLSRMSPDANLHKEQIDRLPKEPGVYYFYDAQHQLIYIGKSVDIRSRVLSHFANNTNVKALEMKAAIAHIRYVVTGSELIALLKESEEIKRFKPIFNRMQRRSRYNVGLFASHDAQGYLQFRLERLRGGGAEPVTAFSTLPEGRGYLERMLDTHRLCQRHMGLHKTRGPCFYHGIHKCDGACVGKEPPADYNARAAHVVDRLQFASSNLLIVDRGRVEGERSLVLIERGRYAGYGWVEKEFMGTDVRLLRRCIQPFADNKEVRQIINHFLRQGKAEEVVAFGD